jgi:uncharacterized protein YecT (DUF1311 family)
MAAIFVSVVTTQAQTQAAINAEARADFVKADVDLNKTYQAVLAKLPPNEKQNLRKAQRAWVASRDAEATEAAKEAEGGSIAPTIRYGRMRELTRKRIAELNAMIGRESSPTEASPSPNNQASSISPAEPTARPTPNPISPDKKWEYKPATNDRGPQIVKAGTNDSAGELSACDTGSCGEDASVLWAPDSRRVAFHWGQGRTHSTSFYQLRDDHWALLDPQPDDQIAERLEKDITAQLKRSGQSAAKLEKKGLYLRYIWGTTEADRWIDSNTCLLYAGDNNIIAQRDDPGEMSDGFGANFLFTLKFDEAGNWKIVNSHRMSEKEVDKRAKEQ